MGKKIAIIGAGPSGLASAKAVLEYGLQPTVFDSATSIGGLWRGDGYTWPEMRTNISRWTNSFSDHPWPDTAADFPSSVAVREYLAGYVDNFGLGNSLSLGTKVEGLFRNGKAWNVSTARPGASLESFDGVIVANGIFAAPAVPDFMHHSMERGEAIHSAQYRRSSEWTGKTVAVIGGSLSGIEIAADLAGQGAQVLLFMSRPLWILPRLVQDPDTGKSVPIDLTFNVRHDSEDLTQEQSNLATAKYLQALSGNPGEVHKALRVPIDASPVYVAISDRFLPQVKAGAIKPSVQCVAALGDRRVTTQDGQEYAIDRAVLCTGYRTDFSFLSRPSQRLLQYDRNDALMPFLAEKSVRPAGLDNLYFVGAYRGPYFGVMELQARWAASMLANGKPDSDPSLAAERDIRQKMPRPQFPHSGYVRFSDELAKEIGVTPQPTGDPVIDRAILEGPVTPAQYRLQGPHAMPGIARAGILSAIRRMEP